MYDEFEAKIKKFIGGTINPQPMNINTAPVDFLGMSGFPTMSQKEREELMSIFDKYPKPDLKYERKNKDLTATELVDQSRNEALGNVIKWLEWLEHSKFKVPYLFWIKFPNFVGPYYGIVTAASEEDAKEAVRVKISKICNKISDNGGHVTIDDMELSVRELTFEESFIWIGHLNQS